MSTEFPHDPVTGSTVGPPGPDAGAPDPAHSPAAPAEPGTPGQHDNALPHRVDEVPVALREPAHRVSPRAVGYWRLLCAVQTIVLGVVIGVVWWLWEDCPTWVKVVAVALWLITLVGIAVEPWFKYRVHRWEVDDVAVHTRTGWINLETRIAPLSRVQTVESSQGVVMRQFGISSLTVTTASAAGPITIEGLDAEEARELVARLTAITGADHGDAT